MTDSIRLLLLRHGEAERHAASDAERNLTAHGRDEAARVARVMQALGITPTTVTSSPYRRARQTAEIVADVLRVPLGPPVAGVTPDDAAFRALGRLEALCVPGALPVVVTHMPFIGALTALLVDGNERDARGFVTAGGVLLAGEAFAPGLFHVVHSLQP